MAHDAPMEHATSRRVFGRASVTIVSADVWYRIEEPKSPWRRPPT